ncbi:MAG: SRPBCC family protein [Phycisphaerales bacterium]|jgi:uncharacterized protein YndB with AHSA1/START domain
MLTWILIVVGSLIVLLAIVFVVATLLGTRLSPNHTVQATLHVAKPVAEVFALVDNLEAQPTWDKGVTRIEPLPDDAGRPRRRMVMGRNSFVLTDTTRQPPTQLVRTISDDHKFFGGSWTFDFTPEGSGTKVTLTEHGVIDPPIPRLMMKHFVDPAMYLKRQLAAMARALGEEPRISEAKRLA